MTIPNGSLPPEMIAGLRHLAQLWLASPRRPRVRRDVAQHWHALIQGWIDDAGMPLLVRKSGLRGNVVQHKTGRSLVPVDNAPANWVLSSALSDRVPSLSDVLRALETGELPVGFAQMPGEQENAQYRGTQRRNMNPPNLNTLEWTVCHIEPVGLGTRQPLAMIAIDQLTSHMRRFLSVENMFLVPTSHAGLGELPEFLEAFREAGDS